MNRMEGSLSTYMTFAGLLMLSGVIALAWAMFQKQTQRWVWVFNRNNNFLPFINPHPPSLVRVFNSFSISNFLLEKKSSFTITDHTFVVYLYSVPLSVHRKESKDMFSGEDTTFEMRLALWKGWMGNF